MTEIVQVYRLLLGISKCFSYRKILLLACAIGGVFTVSLAQDHIFLPLSKLEIKDGLPGINVRKISRDRFGFMWFATQDGISRFDGMSYINLNSYNVNDHRKILGTDIYDIARDHNGRYLWALSAYGGLNKIDITTSQVAGRYLLQNSFKRDTSLWYNCMAETPHYILIGTNEGIISRFHKVSCSTDRSFSLAQRFGCKGHLATLLIDDQQRTWFFMNDHGIVVTDSAFTRSLAVIPLAATVTSVARFNNLLFITTNHGLQVMDAQTMAPVTGHNAAQLMMGACAGQELYSIAIYDRMAVIAGKNKLYLFDLLTGNKTDIQLAGNYENRSWLTLTNALYADRQSIWIGSQYGVGWIRNLHTPFVPYYMSMDGFPAKINHAITLCPSSDSVILVCGDDGLYTLNHYTANIRPLGVKDFYYTVFRIGKGFFLASGVSTGLHLFTPRLQSASLQQMFPELMSIKNELLMCAAQLSDSLVFMASQNKNGLYIWHLKTHTIEVINTRNGRLSLRNDDINRLFVDSQQRLWIVCENVVSVYDPIKKQMTHLNLTDPVTHRPLTINMDICETTGGFWLASYGTGVVEIARNLTLKKIYTARNGYINLGLYKIFAIDDSLILTSSNNGLALLNTRTGYVKNYFTENGLQSNSFEEASGTLCGPYIFVGGINGLTRIDRRALPGPPAPLPTLHLATLLLSSDDRVTDTMNIQLQHIRIPHTVTQVTIGFSAIHVAAPEQIQFAYRFRETDTVWNFTRKNFIQFFRLPPGRYHLQIRAFNEDGVPGNIRELTLYFLPKWYQTWWFRVIIFVLAAGGIYGFYRFRIHQLKQLQEVRNKLAGDLHDDLGSTMNSVKIYASLAIMEKNSDKYLLKVKESVQEAIIGIRDMIWVLDDKKDTFEHLLTRISIFATPVCEANQVLFNQQITDDARSHKLAQEERRNLYMIMKESINNALKYAQASQVQIEVSLKKGKPLIMIKDNGQGFDTCKTTEGNGLKNMARRAGEIKYQLQISSAPGNGTVIQLQKM